MAIRLIRWGQHIMHLAGDPGALVGLVLFDPQRLFGLRAPGPVAKRPQQLAA
ncbi:hypothetical protein Acor_73960 [Acrocarpospora corrugata]|uniref:Uncharacterized protein n=1 Tax=Acrocarpospora corrugata TaxID=35763 RepID=A0A5M3WG09_9ACTN|nr:hypothetical protein [Acrocarpospora corrugata]GES05328.1 hypothetical protein Acor_73960 [Acrocarpospora corrugata]